MPTVEKKTKTSTMDGLMAKIQTTGRNLRPRMVLYGGEGDGKTSLAGQGPNPVFAMSRGETGLETLIDRGQLPEIPHFPEIRSWEELLAAIEELLTQDHSFETFVLDSLNGFEDLLYRHVCDRDFGGDRSHRGFLNYMQGYSASTPYWEDMLHRLDRLREKKNMAVIGIAHAKVATYKSPTTQDYDRIVPAMHQKQWGVTHKWSDLILLLDRVTVVNEDGNKAKALGGTQRICRAARSATWDAKNRHGLPDEFPLGNSAGESWNIIAKPMKEGKKK